MGRFEEVIPMHIESDGSGGAAAFASTPPSSRSGRDEGSEHVVIGRLIRRLRVSESPDRFHVLATTVLRSSLGVDAVAWVPRDARDPVVVSGGVEGMELSAYRSLPRSVASDWPAISEEGAQVRRSHSVPPGIGRYAAAEAGTHGSIVAVNTPDGRAFAPAEIERLHYVTSLIETQLANARIY